MIFIEVDMAESKHDGLVRLVEQELKNRGFTDIHKFEEYKRHSICGEIDIYAIKDDYVLLFEIKSNGAYKNEKKAIKQMNRAEKHYFSQDMRMFKFFVYGYGNGKAYNMVWEKSCDGIESFIY